MSECNCDESDSDDSYFDRLESEAMKTQIDYDDCQPTSFHNVIDDSIGDEEYFDMTINFASQSTMFAHESDSIWSIVSSRSFQSINRDTGTVPKKTLMGMQCISINSESSMITLKQWLFNYLPSSSKLYCSVSSIMRFKDNNENVNIYINDLLNPNIIIVVERLDAIDESSPTRFDLEIFAVPSHSSSIEYSQLILNVLACIIHPQLTSSLVKFCGVDPILIEDFKTSVCNSQLIDQVELGTYPFSSYVRNCSIPSSYINMYNSDKASPSPSSPPTSSTLTYVLSSEYEISNLSFADAQVVNDNWDYKSQHSLQMVYGTQYSI